MNNEDIKLLLENCSVTAPYFRSAVSVTDKNLESAVLAFEVSKPNYYVFNTENQKVGHWLAVCFDSKAHALFFDSYGQTPNYYSTKLEDFIVKLSGDNWTSSSKAIQSDNSCVCGIYCVYFIIRFALGHKIDLITSPFSSNLFANDHMIFKWLKKLNIFELPIKQMMYCEF